MSMLGYLALICLSGTGADGYPSNTNSTPSLNGPQGELHQGEDRQPGGAQRAEGGVERNAPWVDRSQNSVGENFPWEPASPLQTPGVQVDEGTDPPILDPATLDNNATDNRDRLIHAAGSLELALPLGWHAGEVADGREVRLVLTPEVNASEQPSPDLGMWLTYHYRPGEDRISQEDTLALLQYRLELVTEQAELASPPQDVFFGSLWGARQSYSESLENPRDGSTVSYVGFHLMLPTDWGIVEIHAQAPLTEMRERVPQFESVLESLALRAPQVAVERPLAITADAAEIFGRWKAVQSRMAFYHDGTVEILHDGRGVYPLSFEPGSDDARVTALRGKYIAEGDLLLIEWADGSQMNMRWRLENHHLLLTDHLGQVSAMRRLLQ